MPRKSQSPELRPVASNDLDDAAKARLFGEGIDRLERLIEEKDEIVARIRSRRKEMKSDGFGRAEVDYALWLRKNDGQDAAEDMAMRIRIAEWLGRPLGFQAALDLQAAQ